MDSIERNPVRAQLVPYPWLYPGSSAAAYVTGNDASQLLDTEMWQSAFSPAERLLRLIKVEEAGEIVRLCQATLCGRPLSSDISSAN